MVWISLAGGVQILGCDFGGQLWMAIRIWLWRG